MDKKARVEKELRELYFHQAYLKSLEQELEVLNYEYGLRGISYDDIGGGSGEPSDSTGSQAARIVDIRIALDRKIKKYKDKIYHITEVLDLLTEREHKVVIMYYIEYKPWWKIAQEIGYSPRQAQRIKDDAIEKVTIGLYGSDES